MPEDEILPERKGGKDIAVLRYIPETLAGNDMAFAPGKFFTFE